MKKMLLAINVGWYFDLHWMERVESEMTQGFTVEICTSKHTGRFSGTCHEVEIKRSSIGLVNNIKTLLQDVRIVCKTKPDLLHTITIKPNIMFGLIALFLNKPIVLTLPGLGYVFSSKSVKNTILANVILKLYKLISLNKKAIFVFENKADQILFKKNNVCSEHNSAVVPGSGVDINKYKPKKSTQSQDQRLYLLFAARLLKNKGLLQLVEAVETLNRGSFDISLSVAGLIDDDANDRIEPSYLEQLHQEGKINWLGQVSNMEDILPEHDVVVLPTSYGEGIPRVLIEANACGKPVITTNVSGCNEFVIDGVNGIVIQDNSVDSIVSGIKRLVDANKRTEMGQNGRKRVINYYSFQCVINAYKEIYQRVKL
ncbi:glycosyltransferase family 4 protein [Photobacterium sp. ZSDE20]|uniref:Glycosyltransferase family 4 protein n=1 Tax=Photobacterium pectinilyticum TaxID=2906793 RepID=A0ABT1N100_9GAMM|nr:glycosyltransferase family 4 protein [Photobacterium sp. ZSDE20]MCQ1058339.1 glycosyltransferase family 4 protein [Photobacterium sp. ZSDE20]MDD1823134.1 glycosyltransferase family 4 protein [Photobacterium sp. ZSDE20]